MNVSCLFVISQLRCKWVSIFMNLIHFKYVGNCKQMMFFLLVKVLGVFLIVKTNRMVCFKSKNFQSVWISTIMISQRVIKVFVLFKKIYIAFHVGVMVEINYIFKTIKFYSIWLYMFNMGPISRPAYIYIPAIEYSNTSQTLLAMPWWLPYL